MATGNKDGTAGDGDQSLGAYLTALREKRGLSRDEAVSQTRIPKHYIQMMENDDFTLIADQLYLMPFMRRYATFLGLDPDDIATRFIREVQRSESSVVRMSEPIVSARDRRGNLWRKIAIMLAVALVLVTAVGLYSYARRRAAPVESIAPAAEPQPFGNLPPVAQ